MKPTEIHLLLFWITKTLGWQRKVGGEDGDLILQNMLECKMDKCVLPKLSWRWITKANPFNRNHSNWLAPRPPSHSESGLELGAWISRVPVALHSTIRTKVGGKYAPEYGWPARTRVTSCTTGNLEPGKTISYYLSPPCSSSEFCWGRTSEEWKLSHNSRG